jgi:geranylgeranyl reductase family protein
MIALNTSRYDVVVVGAGPAGSSAAYTLARNGFKVALVERNTFPRDKLCGGLLTERTHSELVATFGSAWGPTIEITSNGVSLYLASRLLNSIENYRPICFTSRLNFDAYLVSLAQKAGVTLFENSIVSSVSQDPTIIQIRRERTLEADFIIGADGVNSQVAKSLMKPNLTNLALGLEIEVPLDSAPRTITNPAIYFGTVAWGYSWVFPKTSSQTVGIAGLIKHTKDMRPIFKRFLKDTYGTNESFRFRGHHIPFGSNRKYPGKQNVLLAGDAAGLVEPVTGEGIAFAIRSGRLAAQAVIDAAEAGLPERAMDLYLESYRSISKLFRQARIMRYFIFPQLTQNLFVKVLPHTRTAIRAYVDLLSGEIDYIDYTSNILRKAAKTIHR